MIRNGRLARLGGMLCAVLGVACARKEPRTTDTTIAATHDGPEGRRPGAPAIAAVDTADPAGVVRRYYGAIQSGDYEAAYALWGQSGAASGQSRSQFAAGFAQTSQVHVTIGDSIQVEGAAGSQYATVPVSVDAVLKDGRRQRFVGSYTLRRVMVDGASPEQRRWHIEKAQLSAPAHRGARPTA